MDVVVVLPARLLANPNFGLVSADGSSKLRFQTLSSGDSVDRSLRKLVREYGADNQSKWKEPP